MSNYGNFALYYDTLTQNVDYAGRADYLLCLLKRAGHHPGITLDLACGTGSLTLEFFHRGVDVYGADSSVSMLSVAKEKCYDAQAEILFLCQKMQNLDLYGTVDTVFCSLDSVNHLENLTEMRKAFEKVFFFLNPEGYFVFDFNTLYKHRSVLGNECFVYDTASVFCVWQNQLREKSGRVDISLDFFEKDGPVYRRSRERFSEISYHTTEIRAVLQEIGFVDIHIYDDMSFDPPKDTSERVIFVAKKAKGTTI